MKLHKFISILSSTTIQVFGLSLLFSLSSITAKSVTAVTQFTLIQSSKNACVFRGANIKNYEEAYTRAWLDYSRIILKPMHRGAGVKPQLLTFSIFNTA